MSLQKASKNGQDKRKNVNLSYVSFMKIGIITFHNADNYGAVLQCYALQQFLIQMGHIVEIIDYRNSYIEDLYKPKYGLKNVIKSIIKLKYKKDYINRLHKRYAFNAFRSKYLKLSEHVNKENIPQDYDAYIIGSDQVWTVKCSGGYDPVFFGKFQRPGNSLLIGYAISSQADFLVPLSLEDVEESVAAFDFLSFREKKIVDLVYRVTNRITSITIDPTLLSDEDLWDSIIKPQWSKCKYVVVYEVRKKGSIEKKAKEYARKHNIELVNLSRSSYGIEDFVSIIKYAQGVITTSFHATVYSVIFRTPLCSIKLHDGGDERYVSLLTSLNLKQHIFALEDEITAIPEINEEGLATLLNSYRQESVDFLKCNLPYE